MKLILALALAVSAFGQSNPTVPRYLAKKLTTLSGAAEKVTVQQPAASPVQVNFETADVYCSVACTITFYQNGTAATTTTLTPIGFGFSPPPKAVAFSGSDVGTGNTLKAFTVPAGATWTFDLSMFFLAKGGGGANNFSIGTSSITGDVRIQIQYTEQ